AAEMRPWFWPSVRVMPLVAPWTAFTGKYPLRPTPWIKVSSVIKSLRRTPYDLGVSVRRDPRDHFMLRMSGARKRDGFPRLGSGVFLTDEIIRPQHRYDQWATLGASLGLTIPPRPLNAQRKSLRYSHVIVHSGAARKERIWPLDRYHALADR